MKDASRISTQVDALVFSKTNDITVRKAIQLCKTIFGTLLRTSGLGRSGTFLAIREKHRGFGQVRFEFSKAI